MELDGGWKEWHRHNVPIERETYAPCGPLKPSTYIREAVAHKGNTEGTQGWLRASTRGHSFSADPFALRDLRGRVDPPLPLLPSPDLDGKEGSTVRVRQRLQECPANGHVPPAARARNPRRRTPCGASFQACA